jgi:hypothetical protein
VNPCLRTVSSFPLHDGLDLGSGSASDFKLITKDVLKLKKTNHNGNDRYDHHNKRPYGNCNMSGNAIRPLVEFQAKTV